MIQIHYIKDLNLNNLGNNFNKSILYLRYLIIISVLIVKH